MVFNVHDPEAGLDRAILQAIVGSKQGDPTKVCVCGWVGVKICKCVERRALY